MLFFGNNRTRHWSFQQQWNQAQITTSLVKMNKFHRKFLWYFSGSWSWADRCW